MAQISPALDAPPALQPAGRLVHEAVHRNRPLSREGLSERLFTLAFGGLVYPQIWEDPVVDMAALEIEAGPWGGHDRLGRLQRDRLLRPIRPASPPSTSTGRMSRSTGSSSRHRGTCPTMRASTASSARPTTRDNVAPTTTPIAPHLDPRRARYWEGGRRSAAAASASSRAISTATACSGASSAPATRSRGCMASTRRRAARRATLAEQRALLRRASSRRSSTSRWSAGSTAAGLALRPRHSAGAISGAGRPSRRRHAARARASGSSGSPATSRSQTIISPGRLSAARYAPGPKAALPPYLQREHFDAIRSRADPRALCPALVHRHLGAMRRDSVDRYVLLDAQDWMSDGAQRAVERDHPHRAARRAGHLPHRRRPTLLPGRVPTALLDRWRYRGRTLARARRGGIARRSMAASISTARRLRA